MLTPWLAGSKPTPPWTEALYQAFGRASAHMHLATQSFLPATPGRLIQTDHLIRRPVAKLQHHFADDRQRYERLVGVASRVADELDALVGDLPTGVCHGDLTLDNFHIGPDGTIGFYDFDLGGHGSFAFDFAGMYLWTQADPTAVQWFSAFQAGYREVREISACELVAMRLFGIAYLIWDLEHTIHNWTIWSGTWRATDEIVDGMVATIFERAG